MGIALKTGTTLALSILASRTRPTVHRPIQINSFDHLGLSSLHCSPAWTSIGLVSGLVSACDPCQVLPGLSLPPAIIAPILCVACGGRNWIAHDPGLSTACPPSQPIVIGVSTSHFSRSGSRTAEQDRCRSLNRHRRWCCQLAAGRSLAPYRLLALAAAARRQCSGGIRGGIAGQ